ncbi:MAG: hypothetical protein IPM35_27975 [Myxococcales bacterium]|nr:hypothetical protein [Myxococcales bacterium]
MTGRDTEARAAELAATPWPSPPGTVRHPQAAWEPGEVCSCDECLDGREEAAGEQRKRSALATAALARSASRSASLLSRRLDELARALERDDWNEITYVTEALDTDLDRTGSLLERVEVELACRRAR